MIQTDRERKVQEQIMRVLRKNGAYVYKNAQNMYTEKGRPDLTACVPVKISKLAEIFGNDTKVGLFIGLEVKRDEERGYGVTDAQQIVGRKIQNAKGLWLSIDDVELIEALLLKLGVNQDVI